MHAAVWSLSFALAATACADHEAGDIASIPITPLTADAVFVVNGADNSISVIDAQTDDVIGTIELVGVTYPHHVYASADGARLLVAITGADLSAGHGGGGHGAPGGAVLALDGATGALQAARHLDAPNHNAAFAPDGTVWTTQIAQPGELLILDGQTLATRKVVAVGDEPAEVTFDPSGRYGFVANTGSDSVSIVDVASGEVIETRSVGDAPVGAWPGVDGRMYVDNELGQSISVIDPATRAVVATWPLGFTPAYAAIAPSGELWVTDTDAGKVVFLSASDGTKRGELATGAGAHAIAFSPDGGKAYITNQGADTVTVIDVAQRAVGGTIAVGAKPNGIAFRRR